MGLRYYDDALSAKIAAWVAPLTGKSKIQVLKPDEIKKLYTIEADESANDSLKLPLIAISRNTEIEVRHRTKQPMSYDGLMLESDGEQALQLDAIPVDLTYQIDMFTRRYDEGDELLREMLFKIVNNPQLVVEFTYNNKTQKHVSSILLHSTVRDNSDISERLFSGQFTRWTLGIDIIGAYIFSLPYKPVIKIEDSDIKVY
ncbi:MAG TPA: hypothetical protein GX745_08200 [Clostridiales bacterium]|nr:hypothetical protein [Clostridiales bacterium]